MNRTGASFKIFGGHKRYDKIAPHVEHDRSIK